MKRILIFLMLSAVLLAGCTTQTAQPTEPTETAQLDEQLVLVGSWRNEGQYSEGHEFVETMTLDRGGVCTIHLEYQGSDYQTLEGTYIVSDGMLYTALDDNGGTVNRNFKYTLDGDTLLLESANKEVTYLRVD